MDTVRAELFDRLEDFYDTVPRDTARAEDFGTLTLFVRENPGGFPFYARPRRNADTTPSMADIAATRERQRALGLPETFEWVHERTPDLLAVARSAGLSVLEAPLMLLDPAALPDPAELTDVPVRLLDPAAVTFATDLAARQAVAAVGFATPGTARADTGPAARDAAAIEPPAETVADERHRAIAGRRISALAETPDEGALACGNALRVGDTAEIVGIATLPSARRRGLAAAVTAALARRLVQTGAGLVFLSAGSEEIARVYLRAGFRRIGTACIAEPTAVIG